MKRILSFALACVLLAGCAGSGGAPQMEKAGIPVEGRRLFL